MGDSKIAEGVKKCAAALQSVDNDTDRLSALFVVINLIKDDKCTEEAKELLFKSIGFDFLRRLLSNSLDFSNDCPPSICRSLAMSIFSAFCTSPQLIRTKEMLAQIPVFMKIVADSEGEDDLVVVSEAYDCLKCFASFEEGQKALIAEKAPEKMIEVYTQQCFQCDEALNILLALIDAMGGNMDWAKNDPIVFENFLTKVATDFVTEHSERKFDLCTVLSHLVQTSKPQELDEENPEDKWPALVHKGVSDILCGKISKSQRDPALELAAVMVRTFGMGWTLQENNPNPKQFFLLLTHLCAIEVRMQLEDRSIDQVLNNLSLIVSCFQIIESSLSAICTEIVVLEDKEKAQIYTALKGAFAAIIGLLKKLEKKNAKNPLTHQEKLLVNAIIRVLASWLANGTNAVKPAVSEVLPFVLSFTKEAFYEYRQAFIARKVKSSNPSDFISEPSADDVDLLKIILPALCHLTVEDVGRKMMLDCKEEDVLLECFSFHWSIVNFKKPIVPKSERLKVGKTPQVELPQHVIDAINESRSALISMCNIFMNIIVLDSKFIENSPTFTALLKFVFNNLTELKNVSDNLVLHANMSVLGLLLLRYQSKKVSKTDFSICRYIQSTIRFLWDAYTVDESNHASCLVVSMAYKEHWMQVQEMWYLGMQNMSIVLALIPWISEFIMETGWAQGILDTLKRARPGSVHHNTKAAYEDLLCQLVKTNSSVIAVFTENDALTVCRNHMFMELGKLLFGD